MGEFLKVCPKRLCISTVGTRTDLFARDPSKVPITDFFGSVRNVELTNETEILPVDPSKNARSSGVDEAEFCSSDKFCDGQKMFQYFDQLPILKEV